MKSKLEYELCPECGKITTIKGRYRKMVRNSLSSDFLCLDMSHVMQNIVPPVTPFIEIGRKIEKLRQK